MTVHFICRGNAFRSRMAEAYFNSLNLAGKRAISSGSVADLHSQCNKQNFTITQAVLAEHGLESYTKPHWDQLTQGRIDACELTVCLSQSAKDECDRLFTMPKNTLVWAIPDFDEVVPIPKSETELHDYAEETYRSVVHEVQRLVSTKGV